MKNVVVAGIVAARVVFLVILEVRLIHPTPGLAQLLWDDEALLFIEEAISGWRMSYPEFGVTIAMAALGREPPILTHGVNSSQRTFFSQTIQMCMDGRIVQILSAAIKERRVTTEEYHAAFR